MPAATAEPVDTERLVVAFAQVLRGVGLEVPVGSTVTLGEAWAAVGLEDRDALYWAGRVVVLRRPEDGARYDQAFDAFWSGTAVAGDGAPTVAVSLGLDDGDPDDEPSGEEEDGGGPISLRVRWSPAEVLRSRDFAACSPDELDEARRLIADLRVVGATRRSRRHRPARPGRGQPDLRRTVRHAVRTGGEPITRSFRAPRRGRAASCSSAT